MRSARACLRIVLDSHHNALHTSWSLRHTRTHTHNQHHLTCHFLQDSGRGLLALVTLVVLNCAALSPRLELNGSIPAGRCEVLPRARVSRSSPAVLRHSKTCPRLYVSFDLLRSDSMLSIDLIKHPSIRGHAPCPAPRSSSDQRG